MTSDGQAITKKTYEDRDIVESYIQRNAVSPKNLDDLRRFSERIQGQKVLDLGCGPGHYSYQLAELGFDVTGLDYSSEMIRRAQQLKTIHHQPHFLVGNMLNLTQIFPPHAFDAIWAHASLLHIRPTEMQTVLQGMSGVTKQGAPIFVSLKGGTGTKLVDEDKLGRPMQREFTLWNKQSFLNETEAVGWKLLEYSERNGSLFLGKPTHWMLFVFER